MNTVFFLDLDNTLIDHDRFKREIGRFVMSRHGDAGETAFWELYERIRAETGIVDVIETAGRYGQACGAPETGQEIARMLREFPFGDLVFPRVHATLRRLGEIGRTAVVCDGHEEFQRWKLHVAGIDQLVGGRIHVFIHKETHALELAEHYPATRYVMIDDKPRIHAAMRHALGARLTTVMVKQGHYATAAGPHPHIDHEIATFAEILEHFAPTPAP